MQDSNIRIECALREKFVVSWREQTRNAAWIIREFARTYINQNDSGPKVKRKQA